MSSEYFSSWRPRPIDREAGPGTVHVLPKPGPQGKDLNNLPRSYRLPAEGCQAGQSWHSRNLPLDDISGCTVTHFGNQQVISSTELQESDDGAHKRIIKRYYTLDYRCREIYIPSDIIHEIKAILKADVCFSLSSLQLNLASKREFQRMDPFQRFLGWYTCEGHTFQFYSVYFAMEYFENGHLGQFMGATWLKINARSITEQLLKGLSVLHSREIFHPNMEPKVFTPISFLHQFQSQCI
jgi:serine/threonine protein kinase